MTYDHWKATNPADEFLGPEPEEECECETALCPWCQAQFPSNEPKPGCYECECCFCSEECRTQFHMVYMFDHDFNAPLED